MMLDQFQFCQQPIAPRRSHRWCPGYDALLQAGADKAIEWTKPNDLPLLSAAL